MAALQEEGLAELVTFMSALFVSITKSMCVVVVSAKILSLLSKVKDVDVSIHKIK